MRSSIINIDVDSMAHTHQGITPGRWHDFVKQWPAAMRRVGTRRRYTAAYAMGVLTEAEVYNDDRLTVLLHLFRRTLPEMTITLAHFENDTIPALLWSPTELRVNLRSAIVHRLGEMSSENRSCQSLVSLLFFTASTMADGKVAPSAQTRVWQDLEAFQQTITLNSVLQRQKGALHRQRQQYKADLAEDDTLIAALRAQIASLQADLARKDQELQRLRQREAERRQDWYDNC
jgi:hypothetical protein